MLVVILQAKPGCPFYCQRISGGVLLDGKTRRDMELWRSGALAVGNSKCRQEDERLNPSVNTNVRFQYWLGSSKHPPGACREATAIQQFRF